MFKYLSLDEKEFPVASKMFEKPIFDEKYFKDLTDTFRSPHLWQHSEDRWKLRYPVWENIE